MIFVLSHACPKVWGVVSIFDSIILPTTYYLLPDIDTHAHTHIDTNSDFDFGFQGVASVGHIFK